MKKILQLSLALLISGFTYSQEIIPKLKLTREGVESIVIKTDSLTSNQIYKKALDWVQETYKNPDKVLKAKIENKKIRIDGFATNAWWYRTKNNSYNMEYTIEISIKNGRYKFEFIIGQFFIDDGQKVLYDYKSFFKKSGEIKKAYTDAVPSLENTMNLLSNSFYSYITGHTSESEDDW